MTEKEIRSVFEANSNHPLRKAFLEILHEMHSLNSNACYAGDLSSEVRAFNCGRASATADLLDHIAELSETKKDIYLE